MVGFQGGISSSLHNEVRWELTRLVALRVEQPVAIYFEAHAVSFRSSLLARAKRERVVQDEVEKANRRPTDRHGPTRHGTPHSLFEN